MKNNYYRKIPSTPAVVQVVPVKNNYYRKIPSTPAVAQVVPVKNSYYRKSTSKEKAHGQMGLDKVSLDRSIYKRETWNSNQHLHTPPYA